MESKKVYVVGGSNGYANWLIEMGMELTKVPEEADIAMFTGGADINPAIYGEKPGSRTYFYDTRDRMELEAYRTFRELETPMIGICRGGQLFTALNGHKLVQHSSHPYSHNVVTNRGELYSINSMHHQQFLLDEDNKNYELIAWAENISDVHLDGDDVDYNFPKTYKEPEVVYYPETMCLAIQCHPEAIHNVRTMDYFKSLVNQYLIKEKITA